PQVQLGVESVQPARGDEREEVRGGFGVVVAPDEQPGLATDGNPAQLALAAVIVNLEPAVVEVAAQSVPLADDVPERRTQEPALRLDALILLCGPVEEGVDLWRRVSLPELFACRRRNPGPSVLELEEPVDPVEGFARD